MTYAVVELQVLTGKMMKSDLEFQLMGISNERQQLAWQMANMIGADFNEDPLVAKIQAFDQALELQQNRMETQHKAVSADVESWQKLLTENVKKDHKVDLAG